MYVHMQVPTQLSDATDDALGTSPKKPSAPAFADLLSAWMDQDQTDVRPPDGTPHQTAADGEDVREGVDILAGGRGHGSGLDGGDGGADGDDPPAQSLRGADCTSEIWELWWRVPRPPSADDLLIEAEASGKHLPRGATRADRAASAHAMYS